MPNAIDEMHAWIADCYWRDLDDELLDELTPEEIVAGVERHYDGGVSQFMADCA